MNNYPKSLSSWLNDTNGINGIASSILDDFHNGKFTPNTLEIKEYLHTFTYPEGYRYRPRENDCADLLLEILEYMFGFTLCTYSQISHGRGFVFYRRYIANICDDIYMDEIGIFRIKEPNFIKRWWNMNFKPNYLKVTAFPDDKRSLHEYDVEEVEQSLLDKICAPYINDIVFRSYLSEAVQKIAEVELSGNHKL